MKRTAIRTMVLVFVAASLVGCQSGPQWASSLAWWKHDVPPEDTSAVARSAAPELPSAQTTPPQIAPAAVPPSSANLAAAASLPSASALQAPAATPGVPVASYPTTAAPAAPPAVAATYPATTTAPPYPSTLPATAAAPAGVPNTAMTAQTGPYDPNAYRPTTTPTPASAQIASDSDRYGDVGPDRYTMTPSGTETAPVAEERFAAVPGRYEYQATPPQQPTAAAPTSTPSTGSVYGDNRDGLAAATPPAAVPTAQYPAAATAVGTTAQISTSPGPYRPGGTTSYPVQSASDEVEVASRPATNGAAPPAAPVPATYPSATYPATTQPAGLGTY